MADATPLIANLYDFQHVVDDSIRNTCHAFASVIAPYKFHAVAVDLAIWISPGERPFMTSDSIN